MQQVKAKLLCKGKLGSVLELCQLSGESMKGVVKGSGFPVSHLVLTAGLASVFRLCCHGPRAKERPVGASP